MAFDARHDVEEGEGDIVLIDLVARYLAAQDFREDVVVIVRGRHDLDPCYFIATIITERRGEKVSRTIRS